MAGRGGVSEYSQVSRSRGASLHSDGLVSPVDNEALGHRVQDRLGLQSTHLAMQLSWPGSLTARNASIGNIGECLFDQLAEGFFVTVHAEGDFESQAGVGQGAFLGEHLAHDPVARPVEQRGSAGDLDVNRQVIDQFVVSPLNVRHARQRCSKGEGAVSGVAENESALSAWHCAFGENAGLSAEKKPVSRFLTPA